MTPLTIAVVLKLTEHNKSLISQGLKQKMNPDWTLETEIMLLLFLVSYYMRNKAFYTASLEEKPRGGDRIVWDPTVLLLVDDSREAGPETILQGACST